jgi:hypothetical protein
MSDPPQTKCQILNDFKEKVDALPDNITSIETAVNHPQDGLVVKLADEREKLQTLKQRVDTLDTSAATTGLSCRMVTPTSTGLNSVLPGGNGFRLCQPTQMWTDVTIPGMAGIGLTWAPVTVADTQTQYCTPLHARRNETGRLFDADQAIVCTGGGAMEGSMSRSMAVAHNLRTIRDRFCAAPQ